MSAFRNTMILTTIVIFSVILFACAIDSGRPDPSELGYIKCQNDAECEVGICQLAEPFGYCVVECAWHHDCADDQECVKYRCVGDASVDGDGE